jgi:hypothetical protein
LILFSDGTRGQGLIGYNHSEDSLRFANSGNTERMRIDASGSVGIGNTSPGSLNANANNLVVGSGSGGEGITIYSANDNNAQIFFADGTSGDAQYRGVVRYAHDVDRFEFWTAGAIKTIIDSSGNVDIEGQVTATAGAVSAPTYSFSGDTSTGISRPTGSSINFVTGGTERMRINSNGRLLHFTTTNLEPGDTPTDANCNVSGPGYMFLNRDDTVSVDQITFGKNGAVAGRITTTSSTTYTTTSDYRKKENVTPVVKGLERVQKLNPVSYTWINDEVKVVEEGFLAHEVQEAGWETGVSGTKDGEDVQSMDYGRITPLLVKAIQEQQEQIEQLKTEIQTLKGE